ncbi:MAG: hypothetical protein JWO60_624 [Frankiales bacterium]|nr:hypothetical protein [Frankiales bacterium]
MRRTRPTTLVALAGAAVLLTVPGTALAEGGGGSEVPAPAPTAAACVHLTALTLDDTVTARTASKATLRYSLASCSSVAQSVTMAFTRTWTYDAGSDTLSCETPAWTGPTVTVRAGDKLSVDVPVPVPSCPFGSNGASSYVYATASTTGTAAGLSRARAHVTYRPGV